jgi:tetratricopeptide (TPR) repeat protein
LPAACLVVGCASTGEKKAVATGNEGIDPDRAYLPLAEIQPVPQMPIREMEPPPLSERARKQVERARRLADQSRFAEARSALERALRYEPRHPRIQGAMAMLHLETGYPDVARTHAQKAIESDPASIQGHYVLGRVRNSHEEYEDALQSLRTALLVAAPDGNDDEVVAQTRFHMSLVLEKLGYLTAALTELEQFETYLGGSTGESESTGTPAAPGSATRQYRSDGLQRQSEILERLGRYAKAAEVIHELVVSSPRNFERSERCARLWLRAEQPEMALAVATAMRNEPATPRAEVFALLVDIHRQAGTMDDFVAGLQALHQESPENPQHVTELMDALLLVDRFGEAEATALAFLEAHPQSDEVRERLITAYLDRSDPYGALNQCAIGLASASQGDSPFEAYASRLGSNAEFAEDLLGDTSDSSVHRDYLLGLVALSAGRRDEAMRFFERACAGDADFVPARAALATRLVAAYDYDRALKVAGRRQVDVVEDARLERVLGKVYERLDEDQKAERHFRAALQQNRDDTEAALALAEILVKTNQEKRASLHLKNLLERHPENDAAREMLATIYFDDRKIEATIEQFQILRDNTKSPHVKSRCNAALTLRRNGDIEAYRNTMKEALDTIGEDAETWLSLAESYDAPNMALALDAYDRAIKIDPDNDRAWDGLVRAHEILLNFEKAADLLEQMLPRRPNRHSWRFQFVRLLNQTLQYERILSLAEGELRRDDLEASQRRQYRGIVSGTLRRLERNEERVRRLRAWAAEDPDDVRMADVLASALMDAGSDSESVDIFESLYAKDPQNPYLFERLVNLLHAAGQHSRAAQVVLRMLEEDPLNRETLLLLIAALVQADMTDDAIDLVHNQMLSIESDRETYQDIKYRVLLEAKRFDEAQEFVDDLMVKTIEVLEMVVRHEGVARLAEIEPSELIWYPDRPYSQGRLEERVDLLRLVSCEALLGAKRFADGEERVLGWLEVTRNPRVRFLMLGRLRLFQSMLGKYEEASASAERALMMEPDDIGLNNDVAYGWIDKGIRLKEAERRIRFAVYRRPVEGAYLDTLGWLMYKKGQFQEARKWLTRAAAFQDGGDAVILDHLGDTCWRSGDKDAAVKFWSDALAELEKSADPEDMLDSDSLRVKSQVPGKIAAAKAGSQPVVAGLGKPEESEESQ